MQCAFPRMIYYLYAEDISVIDQRHRHSVSSDAGDMVMDQELVMDDIGSSARY